MQKITSKDGTPIAYDRQGSGPAVILVDGALCYRAFGPMAGVAKLLDPYFTVYTYDRRGRGNSGDTQPYSVQREIEDLDALIQAAGGPAYLYGVSSGGALALETAIQLGGRVKKLAIYEAPYNTSEGARKAYREYTRQLNSLIGAGRRGDAAALFMNFIGTPEAQIEGMRQSPVWATFESIAPTLAYDAAVLGEDQLPPIQQADRVKAKTLVMNGGAGMPFMADTAKALEKAIPSARRTTLEGQRHDVSAEALAPVLIEFFREG